MKTLYLCGGINKLSDQDAKDWREAAKTELAGLYEFLDPMRRDYRGKELKCFQEIVDGDLQDIAASDVLLVNAFRPSWGTAMEVFAAQQFKPNFVLTVCPLDQPSPWLLAHSDRIVRSFEEAFTALRDTTFSNGKEESKGNFFIRGRR